MLLYCTLVFVDRATVRVVCDSSGLFALPSLTIVKAIARHVCRRTASCFGALGYFCGCVRITRAGGLTISHPQFGQFRNYRALHKTVKYIRYCSVFRRYRYSNSNVLYKKLDQEMMNQVWTLAAQLLKQWIV